MPPYISNIPYDLDRYQLYNQRPQQLDDPRLDTMASGPHTFAICVVR